MLVVPAAAAVSQSAPGPASPAPVVEDPLDFNASPAEYGGATAGETFARAVGEICPRILDGRIDLDGADAALAQAGLSRVAGAPSFLRSYPQTHWFAISAAPNNVFLSIDADPRVRRCRVAFANNLLVGAAHLWTDALLARGGGQLVMRENDTRRNLQVSIHARQGQGAFLFLVQTAPQPEHGGRGWQGDASVITLTRERAQAYGLPFEDGDRATAPSPRN